MLHDLIASTYQCLDLIGLPVYYVNCRTTKTFAYINTDITSLCTSLAGCAISCDPLAAWCLWAPAWRPKSLRSCQRQCRRYQKRLDRLLWSSGGACNEGCGLILADPTGPILKRQPAVHRRDQHTLWSHSWQLPWLLRRVRI